MEELLIATGRRDGHPPVIASANMDALGELQDGMKSHGRPQTKKYIRMRYFQVPCGSGRFNCHGCGSLLIILFLAVS